MSESPYKNAIIYFWSGTGNSYRVSTWLGKIAEGKGLNTRVLSIDRSNPGEDVRWGDGSVVGIVFPTHGFTAPWHIVKFAWRLPRGASSHAFCVTTRAGLKIGPVFIPGIGGSSTFVIALMLALKGYNVLGSLSVDMPSNWYSLHPIQGAESQDAICARAGETVARFMEKILTNGRAWFTANTLYEFTWGILLSLISIGYLLFGRFFLAKLFFANGNCDGCGVCARYCSVDAITMWGKENPRPFWKYTCESCMRCSAFCPRNAVEAGHSWGVILYFIVGVPVSAYLFSWLHGHVSGVEHLEGGWVGRLVDLLYFYPAIFLSYFVFNALVRIPAVNWIFTHTTMTHLPFWGRYRESGTTLKNFAVLNKKARHPPDP